MLPPHPLRRAPRPATWLILGSVAAALAIALGAGSIDLDVYLRAAADLAAGRDMNETPAGQLPWLYPPIAALPYAPLLWLPSWASASVAALVSLAALARTLHLVLARLVPGRPTLTPVALAVAVVVEPVASTLGYGQVNLVVAWLVTEGLLGRRAWLIGVAAAVKLTPLVFVLPLLIRRDVRGLGQVATGFAASVLAGWLVAPAASESYWGGLFLNPAGRIGLAYASNQSLTGVVWRAAGEGGVPVLTASVSVAVVLVGVAILRRPDTDEVLALAVTGVVGLLVSPISWVHHWVWALPLALWLATHGRRWLALAWGLLLVARTVWWFPAGGVVEYTHGPLAKVVQDSWAILALVTLGALAARGRERAASEPAPDLVAT